MEVMQLSVLIGSSPETLRWLGIIKSNISKEIPSAEYSESMHWASFKNPATNRKFVRLNPLKKQIRLFTELPVSFDIKLEPTPSSRRWAKTHPSIFKIQSEHDIERATYFIIKSYNFDLDKGRSVKS